jgi:micrococcal nuclease
MGQCLAATQHVLTEVTADSNSNAAKPNEAVSSSGGNKPATSSSSGSDNSAVYSSLPSEAEKVTVRNVYDGDTLTLTDERRVRFLGIDTPEIKENQPYSHEAKAYTKDRCDKQDIWISFEPGQTKEDHYGRLLAFVWVKQGSGYLCLNEGIVSAGYATAYTPNKDSQLHNWDKFVQLQNEARSAGRGMWSTFQDATVYKTANGSAYHKRNCKHLAEIRNLKELKASEASAQGLHPCRTCLAD